MTSKRFMAFIATLVFLEQALLIVSHCGEVDTLGLV